MTKIKIGDHVKPSRDAKEFFPRYKEAIGVVVDKSPFPDCYVVLWTGLKTPRSWHRQFLDKL